MNTTQGMKKTQGRTRPKRVGPCAASECGVTHSDCPNTWKGTCDREAGHSGSHHCDKCMSYF
ncbi:MAG TPA: hypothetical protein VF789_34290 [Thermoanaerobaculia bacterium]